MNGQKRKSKIEFITLNTLQTPLFLLLNTTFYSVKHNFSYCVKHNNTICTIIILEFLNTITSYNFLLIIVLCCMLPSRALISSEPWIVSVRGSAADSSRIRPGSTQIHSIFRTLIFQGTLSGSSISPTVHTYV